VLFLNNSVYDVTVFEDTIIGAISKISVYMSYDRITTENLGEIKK